MEDLAQGKRQRAAAVGATEHGNSAVLVTFAPGGEVLDRRRIKLTRGLPTHPHHHEGSWAVGREDAAAFLLEMGRSIGPPWQAQHKLAAAAAIAAIGRLAARPSAG